MGIGFYGYSDNNTLTNNIINSAEAGIIMASYFALGGYSNNTTLKDNSINIDSTDAEFDIGISIRGSSNNLINNTVDINSTNVTMGYGIGIYGGSLNTLTNNIVNISSISGIFGISIYESSLNTVMGNIVTDNLYGIILYNSSNNLIYNNYFNNTNNAIDNGNNIWNISKILGTNIVGGSWLGGNYWSDYAGKDLDEDGLGDTLLPYNSSGNITNGGDWLPLVKVEEEPYTKTDVGVTTNITLANPSDLVPYLPPEYAGVDISNAVVLTVNVTDNTPDNLTDDAYTDITIKIGELDIETCKVFKTGIGFLPEVDDVTTRPTVSGEPAFSRDLVNKTVTVRLYVGDPLLGVIPPAAPSVFDTGKGTYPSIMGTHKGEIKPSCNITVSKLYTYPCPGTGGHTESIELYENGTLIANGTWEGYAGDWHNITFDKTVVLLAGETYNYTIRTGSYPQIHHTSSLKTENGWINCTEFTDANGNKYDDWIPAIMLWS